MELREWIFTLHIEKYCNRREWTVGSVSKSCVGEIVSYAKWICLLWLKTKKPWRKWKIKLFEVCSNGREWETVTEINRKRPVQCQFKYGFGQRFPSVTRFFLSLFPLIVSGTHKTHDFISTFGFSHPSYRVKASARIQCTTANSFIRMVNKFWFWLLTKTIIAVTNLIIMFLFFCSICNFWELNSQIVYEKILPRSGWENVNEIESLKIRCIYVHFVRLSGSTDFYVWL